jgi:hypothetical protein
MIFKAFNIDKELILQLKQYYTNAYSVNLNIYYRGINIHYVNIYELFVAFFLILRIICSI